MNKILNLMALCCVAGLVTSCFCYHGDECCPNRGYRGYNVNVVDSAPDFRHSAPDCGHQSWGHVEEAYDSAPDYGHSAPDCEHSAPDFGHSAPDFGHSAPDFGHSAPDCGHGHQSWSIDPEIEE